MKDIEMSIINSVSLFKDNIKELKEISEDKTNGVFLTESKTPAVDFDYVKTCYANGIGKSENCAKSVDGLLEVNEIITLIEFKNTKVRPSEIKHKMKDSLLLLCDILNTQISKTRKNMQYIVVYNKEKNKDSEKGKMQESKSRNDIANHYAEKGGTELIKFDLEKYVDFYFCNVHTYNEEEFKEYLLKNNLYV